MELRVNEDDAIEELLDDLLLVGLEGLRGLGKRRLGLLVYRGLGDLSLARMLCSDKEELGRGNPATR